MSGSRLSGFLHDERGGGTVWGLFTAVALIGFAGLAVDTTDGFRNLTMLQATADAAALAAVIDLPRGDNAIASAVEYAEKNLPPETYGTVLTAEDVAVGTWDHDNRVFLADANEPMPDAVRVRVRTSYARGNAVIATFLRIIGVKGWEQEVVAIAQRFIPPCLQDGLIARGYVDMSGNNEYYNTFCVHGQQGVSLQNGNYFESGTSVSMPDLSMLTMPTDGFNGNPGLEEALHEGFLDPRLVDHVSEYMDMLLDPTSPIQPIYIDQSKPVVRITSCNYDMSTIEKGRIYHVDCPANKQIQIPGGQLFSEVVVVSEAQIKLPANAMLEDVVLSSRAETSNSGANIHFSSGAKLGRNDDCAEGGGVNILTTQNLFFSSSVTYNGVQVVSAKHVELGTSDQGVKGLSVQAGGNITLSSNNKFGLCSGEDPLLTRQHYRLVM